TSDPEEEGSGDDIIAGCYSLEIGIEGFPLPRIWIRAEYTRIYDALEARYRMPVYPYKASAVTHYLFVEEGVYEVPDKFQNFKVFVWTLVDSDHAEAKVPEDLVMHGTRHFVICSTSPNQDRWSRLHKTLHHFTFIMNPWKSKEILRVTSMLPPGAILRESVDPVLNKLGPTPRLCIVYLCSYRLIEEYRRDVQEVISNLTTSELQRLLQDSRSLSMNAVSHKICLISREGKENVYSSAIVSLITSLIKSRLANRFRTLERDEQIRLYKHLPKATGSRAMTSFFEAAA
ncbi:hypothetical protein AX15_006042, partial [Amanita polypyramis BW_CC]